MGEWFLRLTVRILAILQLTVDPNDIVERENFYSYFFFTTYDQNLSIFTPYD